MDPKEVEVDYCSWPGLNGRTTLDQIFEPSESLSWSRQEEVDDEWANATSFKQVACPQAPLIAQPSAGPYQTGHSALTLLISDGIHPGICGFFPYSRRFCFKDEMDIDIRDVLYSSGEWFLIREENFISFWNINLQQKWFITEVNRIVHQGYFCGKPPFDGIVILAAQDPPMQQQQQQQTITYLWLGSVGNEFMWQKETVRCSSEDRGINSIILFKDMVLWLSDNGSLFFVKRCSEGVKFDVQRGVCTSNTMNFSLVEHLNKLYIVKSGGFLPYEAPGIYEIIPGVPMVIQQRRLHGKDVFVVHKQGGFMLESSKDDCRIFTGSMLPDVDCAMFSYKNNCNEKIKRCESGHHLACNTVWSVLRTVSPL
ncbi:unnamed protein product [Urochloa humidicola]